MRVLTTRGLVGASVCAVLVALSLNMVRLISLRVCTAKERNPTELAPNFDAIDPIDGIADGA